MSETEKKEAHFENYSDYLGDKTWFAESRDLRFEPWCFYFDFLDSFLFPTCLTAELSLRDVAI